MNQLNDRFQKIYDETYPKTLRYLETMYDNNRDDNGKLSIRDMQGLSDDGIIDLGRTYKLSKLTDYGRAFVEWFREIVKA